MSLTDDDIDDCTPTGRMKTTEYFKRYGDGQNIKSLDDMPKHRAEATLKGYHISYGAGLADVDYVKLEERVMAYLTVKKQMSNIEPNGFTRSTAFKLAGTATGRYRGK